MITQSILIQVSQWKRQLLDGACELFTRWKKTRDKEEGQAKEAELFQQIGRLQIESLCRHRADQRPNPG